MSGVHAGPAQFHQLATGPAQHRQIVFAIGIEPAQRFRYSDGAGEVGVIPSVTRPFCGSCDRVRLTSEGALRNCLFASEEVDLRAIMRGGGSDDDIERAVLAEVRRKGPGHAIGSTTFVRPRRSMSQIGG